MSEVNATLVPFGHGATIEHLATGGLVATRPQQARSPHGVGLTGSLPGGGPPTPAPGSPQRRSASTPSLHGKEQRAGTGRSRHWEWDDARSARSTARKREAANLARLLGQTVLSSGPAQVPLGVTKSAHYRRLGLVHGEAR